MKLLAINSSPKQNGQTVKLLNLFINRAKKLNVEVKRIDLYQEKIGHFSGELQTKPKYSALQKEMLECDGFVIATPTYWFNTPGILKDFIDNLTPMEENGWKLEGKVVGFIVYSPEGGETPVLQNLAMTFNQMGALIPPYGMIFYRGKMDSWAIEDCRDLADRLVQTITAIKGKQVNWL